MGIYIRISTVKREIGLDIISLLLLILGCRHYARECRQGAGT